ncbi:lyase family protein [Chitinivibrio alkaliphilus]|uniref:Fumarate lyase n=1 Tax=Chitinivibrio alkaliphilus ACht1 TaxID=1313304 RepID=U7D5G2_9BACT|nr:lyase family protein [Chitinivibrio alkaliphilus]ERP30801.1 fumarate lyase [Chitinivibrio alkaliphilus ACht1]
MRKERDLLGSRSIPGNALYGIHTQRAIDNFGRAVLTEGQGRIIHALAEVKKAALQTNQSLGMIPDSVAPALEQACNEICAGRHDDHFPVPFYQGGGGTSTNMNINEVIANRALELCGFQRGEYTKIDPVELVNLHQSTNDVYPTAIRIALLRFLQELESAVTSLQNQLQEREQEFSHVITLARTEWEDAVPITMGAQFASFAGAIERDRWRCFKAQERIRLVNIGGTAVGTGLTAPRKYIHLILETLRQNTGLPLGHGRFLMDVTANQDDFVEVLGTVRALAATLVKIGRDLRFLHTAREIRLEPAQAGSSIMPGKINPVHIECCISCAVQAQSAADAAERAASMGTLQINEFLPLLGENVLQAVGFVQRGSSVLHEAVSHLTVDAQRCCQRFENSPVIITAFVQSLGYKRCEKLLSAYTGDMPFQKYLEQQLGKDFVAAHLTKEAIMALGHRSAGGGV